MNDHHGELISVVIVHAIHNIHVVIIFVNSIDENLSSKTSGTVS
jgi:hypothetical protein